MADFGLGAGQQQLQRRVVQPAQHQHLTAGQQRPVQREGWVFGRGANQDDRAILDVWQQRVLLRL